MPIPNRLNPVVPRISRWRVFSITLLLVLFTPQINAAPVDTLTPISTARVYPAPAFEKPGDFNKSFVNILFIERGSDIAGILIAGHTRIEVCRQLSRIMVEMYAELDDLDYEFGEDFYLGYGIFDGVVDPELSSIYNKYAQKISDINNANAGILLIQRIPLDTYRSIRSELDKARTYARNNRTTLITTLHLPRNFQTFARERSIDREPMNRLLETIRTDTLEMESRMAEMEAERNAVEEAAHQLLELPAMDGIHYVYTEGRRPDSRNNREQIRKHMQTADFQNQQQAARQSLQSIYNRFKDNPITPAGKRMAAFSKAMLESYGDSAILQKIQNTTDDVYLTEVNVSWKPLRDTRSGREFIEYLQLFVSSLDNFIEFSRGLGEMHSLTLLDASMRGWPALDFSEYGDIYRQAVQLRIQQDVQGQYHFFRGNENDYHLYASLSGTVLHVTNGQTDRFVQIEDLIQDTAQIPDESQVRRQLLDSLPDDTRVAVATVDLRNPDHPYRSAPSTPDATIDLSSITNDFFKSDFDRTGMLTRLRGSAPMDRSAQHMFPLQSEVRNRRRVYTGDLFYIQPGQYQLRISPAGQLRADSTLRYLLNKMIADPATQRLFAVGRAVNGTRTPTEIESLISKPSHFMRVMLPAILPVQLDVNQPIDAEMLSLRRGDPFTQLSKEQRADVVPAYQAYHLIAAQRLALDMPDDTRALLLVKTARYINQLASSNNYTDENTERNDLKTAVLDALQIEIRNADTPVYHPDLRPNMIRRVATGPDENRDTTMIIAPQHEVRLATRDHLIGQILAYSLYLTHADNTLSADISTNQIDLALNELGARAYYIQNQAQPRHANQIQLHPTAELLTGIALTGMELAEQIQYADAEKQQYMRSALRHIIEPLMATMLRRSRERSNAIEILQNAFSERSTGRVFE